MCLPRGRKISINLTPSIFKCESVFRLQVYIAGKVGTLLSTCIVIEYASSGNLAKNLIFHTIETHRSNTIHGIGQ